MRYGSCVGVSVVYLEHLRLLYISCTADSQLPGMIPSCNPARPAQAQSASAALSNSPLSIQCMSGMLVPAYSIHTVAAL